MSTGDLIQQMAEQGASQEEPNGVIANTIGMLRSSATRATSRLSSSATWPARSGHPEQGDDGHHRPRACRRCTAHRHELHRAMMDRIDSDTVNRPRSSPTANRIYMDSVNYRAIMNDLDSSGRDDHYTKNIALSPLPKYASGTGRQWPGWPSSGRRSGWSCSAAAAAGHPRRPDQSMLAAGGTLDGGASIVVNVHGSATAADGQAVVDACCVSRGTTQPCPVKVSA